MYKLITVFTILLFISCDQGGTDEVEGAGVEHLVFLNLRPDLRPSEISDFKSYLKELEKIEGVIALKVEERSDVGDERALDYDMIMKVWLKDEAALQAYDRDSLHEEIRNILYAYLYEAPATFDIID